jgi:hypothetical protein
MKKRNEILEAKCVNAMKESEAIEYWPFFCQQSKNYPGSESLLSEALSLKKALPGIISSTLKNAKP